MIEYVLRGRRCKRDRYRVDSVNKWKQQLEESEGGIDQFSRGFEKMGFQILSDCIVYREWAPNAKLASLVGDFSKSKRFYSAFS